MTRFVRSRNQAFSLLEISIVLVVIALLAGLVVAGQEVVQNSRLQSIVTDLSRFQTAIDTFKTKYNYLPGDMPNAEDYWGSDSTGGGTLGCPESTAGRGVVKTATCNGNGSGKLDVLATATWPSRWHEGFRLWQHLGDAGLLQEKFSGTDSTAGFGLIDPGINVPVSKLRKGTYYPADFGMAGDLTRFNGFMGLTLIANSISNTGFLLPSEVAYIDRKVDDGLPGYGKIQAGKPTGDGWPTCTTTTDPTTSVYANHKNAICGFYYITGYQ